MKTRALLTIITREHERAQAIGLSYDDLLKTKSQFPPSGHYFGSLFRESVRAYNSRH